MTARNLFLVQNQAGLPRILNACTAAQEYALTQAAVNYFESLGIVHYISSGTALGLCRHGGIIPWDDDIDLFIAPEHTEILRQAFESGDFTRHTGLEWGWDDNTMGWRVYRGDGGDTHKILGDAKFPFLDLFTSVRDEKTGRVTYRSNLMHAWAPQEYFTEEEWTNWKWYDFGPIQLRGPQNLDDYFKRAFGEPAQDLAYLLYHHVDFDVKKWPQRVIV
ncbi:MAG: LicD family protein, partial [Chlamydiia bacterium]|nr:LicD family protein [Chlamydiia bacterium]